MVIHQSIDEYYFDYLTDYLEAEKHLHFMYYVLHNTKQNYIFVFLKYLF